MPERVNWFAPAAMLRLPLLASTLLVTACANMFGSGAPVAPVPSGDQATLQSDVALPGSAGAPMPPAVPPSGPKVGILLPLSGPNGSLGEGMLRAARLALDIPGSPILDPHDTAGPSGAANAETLAIQAGDRIILGPLTSADTAQVAPIATAANIPVLAFTSDVTQAHPGVWVMGVTPEQQVRRLIFAAKQDGRSRIAALLPSSALGEAMAQGLTVACADAGLPPPTILTHAGTSESIDATMKQLSDFTTRRGVVDQQLKDTAASAAPAASAAALPGQQVWPAPAAPLSGISATAATTPPVVAPAPPMPPPPFDALLLGDTGLQLQQVITALHTSGITSAQVRIMGPTLWGAFASKLHALAGAWYAGPQPTARLGFVQQYQAAYHQSPKPLSDIPYDAAALARSTASKNYNVGDITRADGFAGVDGVFALKPDGHVLRALAIFQVQPGGGATIIQPAPNTVNTGS